jgi:hypothetical protein
MAPFLQMLVLRCTAPRDEAGLTTAELLGNAALGVLALVAIWGAMRVLGLDIVDWIRGELLQ